MVLTQQEGDARNYTVERALRVHDVIADEEIDGTGDAIEQHVLVEMGFQDFAGSIVVHAAGASAALAAVILVGARKGKYGPNGEVRPIPGANLPMATLGMFILWMGWFGFNGGSELKIANVEEANAVARIFLNTNAAAAAGAVVAALFARMMFGKTDITMTINGALAGLVSITAEPLMPSPGLAVAVGAVGGVVVVLSVLALDRLRLDDPVGAISVHGTAGIWGIFAVLFSNPDATFTGQMVGTLVIIGWMFAASLVALMILRLITPLRVTEEEELDGMDLHECGMLAYPEFGVGTQSTVDNAGPGSQTRVGEGLAPTAGLKIS
jgi:ammonium transporter, Amt family